MIFKSCTTAVTRWHLRAEADFRLQQRAASVAHLQVNVLSFESICQWLRHLCHIWMQSMWRARRVSNDPRLSVRSPAGSWWRCITGSGHWKECKRYQHFFSKMCFPLKSHPPSGHHPVTIRSPSGHPCQCGRSGSQSPPGLCGMIAVLKPVDQCSQHLFEKIERPNRPSWNRFLCQKATNFLRLCGALFWSEWRHSASLRLWRSPDSLERIMISEHAP